jgi:hypothetical protein
MRQKKILSVKMLQVILKTAERFGKIYKQDAVIQNTKANIDRLINVAKKCWHHNKKLTD